MGKQCLNYSLTSRVLFAVHALHLAMLSPLDELLSLDTEEASLDMGEVIAHLHLDEEMQYQEQM